MPKDLLIRNVTGKLNDWIEVERHQRRMTKQEFVLKVLEDACTYGQGTLFDEKPAILHASPTSFPFTFIDLFAGIGGFRLGLQRVGGRCVFTSEWDSHAQKTYNAWFGEMPVGDIREVKPAEIPEHDILAAGFPCQPFSIAGVSKKKSLGKAHGFKDLTQGTLFFYLATIIEIKKPPILLLENVKNLVSHEQGRTFQVIKDTLSSLGYAVYYQIIDAQYYVPQHRERILIVGFDKRVFGDEVPFRFPSAPLAKPKLRDILEAHPSPKYTLSNHLWTYLKNYAEKHRLKGNGFGYGLADLDGVTRTLSARYYKDGSEILIPQGDGKNPRRLTPREAARLMGFPDDLRIVVSDTQAYRQFGNSVVPDVVEAVGKQIVAVIHSYIDSLGSVSFLKGRAARAAALSTACESRV